MQTQLVPLRNNLVVRCILQDLIHFLYLAIYLRMVRCPHHLICIQFSRSSLVEPICLGLGFVDKGRTERGFSTATLCQHLASGLCELKNVIYGNLAATMASTSDVTRPILNMSVNLSTNT